MGAAIPSTPNGKDSLLILYDDFVEFQESCAFLCEAISSMVGDEDRFDACTAMGIIQFCDSIKSQSQELRRALEKCKEQPTEGAPGR